MRNRTPFLTALLAGALCVVPACGDNDSTDSPDTGSPPGSPGAMATTAISGVDSAFDKTKLAAFVAAFRTGYSDLAQNRSDEDIEQIVIASCTDLANGVDEQTVTVRIQSLAAHEGTEPTPEQAERLYDLVTPACP
ncbi:hypothetical protein [Rhodococcus sp. DMU1]|uniref:hypothetical protein n=1 Tax=Rhodococcus sp. DMU1 TaxID=2722825 RepID=UPI00143E5EDC|nr:hypothetical protein [Rhodococcus sp. DMU1]QIX53940.1 hypothetical protein HFP48_30805 [Rhodococcus sp. DMU1]